MPRVCGRHIRRRVERGAVARPELRPHIWDVAKERAIWTGAISFGLVTVPVRLHGATKSHDIAFHQFEGKSGKRIHNRRVVEGGTREVAYDDIVKGYEVSKGKVVLIEPKEIEALAPAKMRTIDIENFVDVHEIDPLYWDTTYFIAPDERAGAAKSYVLLRKAMEETERVGIGRFVMRTKEYLVTIRPLGAGLVLETMYHADEVRDVNEVIPPSVKKLTATADQVALAKQLMKTLEAPFEPKRYKDTFRDRVMDLIKRKGRGEEIDTEVEETGESPVVDLMEALKASLSGAKKPLRGKKDEAPKQRDAATAGKSASGKAQSKSLPKTNRKTTPKSAAKTSKTTKTAHKKAA